MHVDADATGGEHWHFLRREHDWEAPCWLLVGPVPSPGVASVLPCRSVRRDAACAVVDGVCICGHGVRSCCGTRAGTRRVVLRVPDACVVRACLLCVTSGHAVRAACSRPWLLPLPTHRAVTTLDSPTSGPTGVWQAWHQRSAPRCLVLSWRRLCSRRRVEPAAARVSTTRPRSSTRCSSILACVGSVLRVPGGSSSESCRCGELPSEGHTSSSLRRLCSGIHCLGLQVGRRLAWKKYNNS